MMALEPITRQEQLLNAVATGEDVNIKPITREEMFLAKAAGQGVQTPTPITRREMFLSKIAEGGGSGGGDTGWVVCEAETVSASTSIAHLRGIRLRCPNAASIPSMAFFNHPDILLSIDLPNATEIGERAFSLCNSLTSVDLPVATSIGNSAFSGCTPLTSVDLPAATSIGENAFYGCTALDTLILRNTETVCELIVTAVIGTKIVTAEGMPTGEGFIYVHAKFYEDYVTLIAYQAAMLLVGQGMGEAEAQATADYIARAILRKIEDYPEICG